MSIASQRPPRLQRGPLCDRTTDPAAGLASRPDPGPRPEVGGYGHEIPSGRCREGRPGDGSPSSPCPRHRRDWRAVARTAQRPVPMVDVASNAGLPPCWRYGSPGRTCRLQVVYSPSWSIRQYLAGPTLGVLWGGQDRARHDQMLLRAQHTTKSRRGVPRREYVRGQGEASGGVPGGWSVRGPSGHRFRQRAIDTAAAGPFPRGEHGLRS
jgi:hypothetical protein